MSSRLRRSFIAGLCALAWLLDPRAPIAGAPYDSGSMADGLDQLTFRELGPAVMGGRVDDFAVVERNPDVIFVATASGGIWRTTDGGITWMPIFDHVGPMSIGAIAVSQRDPSIVWTGTGEPNNRNTSSWGAGVFKSTDGGNTWASVGLADTHHIGQIEIDPRNDNVVYVAALGHLWGPNDERGLYKTTDGGRTWNRVLFANPDTGVVDVKLDPERPDTIYAATYQRRRTAYGFNGGGPGSALYKSTDGGATWKKLLDKLPYASGGDTGRIGIAVYRKNPRVVYAEVEHPKNGGLYRSEDRGETWTKMSSVDPNPAYFSRFRIDPNNDLRLYVAAMQSTGVMAGITVSEDGGKTFRAGLGDLVHPDFHAMWIDPANSDHMIIGVDGGVYVSRNGGSDWEHLNQIRIGQAYQIGYDMSRPYHVCAGFQDNGSMCGPSANRHVNGITNADWLRVMAGDGFHTLPDQADPNLVYVEAQEGQLRRLNLTTHEWASIAPEPREGEAPYRFYWNAPVISSSHDPKTLYFAAQYVFRSTDRGDSWKTISPDLTTGVDRNTLPIMGVAPKDQTVSRGYGVTSYPCIIRVAESPIDANVLWAGTDDGNLQVTRDGGKTWTNVVERVRGVAKGTYVSGIEPSHAGAGAAFVVFDAHRADDFGAYIFATSDYGATWTSVSGDLPRTGSVRVVREDPRNTSLLFAGTEFGAYVSFDRGQHWSRLESNLPTVRVDDIQIHPREHDLILATHGRSLWILDDIAPLEQLAKTRASALTLFDIRPAVTWRRFGPTNAQEGSKPFSAPNPPDGALITYYLKGTTDHVRLTVTDRDGRQLRQLDGTGHAGINRVSWDLRYPPPVPPTPEDRWATSEGFFSGFIHADGPAVEPGDYTVTVHAGNLDAAKPLHVEEDPSITISAQDRTRRHDAIMQAYDLYGAATAEAQTVKTLRSELTAVMDSWKGDRAVPIPDGVRSQAETFSKTVDDLNLLFVGRQNAGAGAPLSYVPPPVTARLADVLYSFQSYTAAPRSQDLDALAAMTRAAHEASARLKQAVDVDLPKLNKAMNDAGVPHIALTPARKPS
jgi:photosystem II stability/assembly factor-like uncharacterized protein